MQFWLNVCILRQNGTVRCEKILCPSLDCPDGTAAAYVSGSCCKECQCKYTHIYFGIFAGICHRLLRFLYRANDIFCHLPLNQTLTQTYKHHLVCLIMKLHLEDGRLIHIMYVISGLLPCGDLIENTHTHTHARFSVGLFCHSSMPTIALFSLSSHTQTLYSRLHRVAWRLTTRLRC